MPVYDFKCHECGNVSTDNVLPITHTEDDLPVHCGIRMNYFITSPPMVIWSDPIIDAFRPVATPDAPIIQTTRQHREYMARHDFVDANDMYTPPTQAEERRANEEAQATIDAITPTSKQKEELRKSGLESIIEE
jgi:hypothetical protein